MRHGQYVFVMYKVKVKLTALRISVALLGLLFLPLVSRRMRVFALVCAVLIAAIAASGMFTPSQFLSVVLFFFALTAILLIVIYGSQWYWLMTVPRQVLPLEVTFNLWDGGCEVTCNSWSQSFARNSFSGFARFFSVVLVEIKGNRTNAESTRELLKAYQSTQDARLAESAIQPLGLPIIWLRPVSEKTYLVIPVDALDRSQWTALRKAWLHSE